MAATTTSRSVTEASRRGVAGLVGDAERGETIVVHRHDRPVAAIIGIDRLHELEEARDDLRDMALVLARVATDDGSRTSIDDVLAAFGHTRETIEQLPD